MAEHGHLVRKAGGVGLATLASRILGFVRDMLTAYHFGTGIYASAFLAAFRIPNLFRRLFGEGALSASFIPVFMDALLKKNQEEAWKLALVVFNLLFLVLTGITLLGMAGAPIIARIVTPGFTPEKIELTARILRILFPYLLFIGLATLAGSILNSFKHFALPAIIPIILNLFMIAALIFFVHSQSFAGIRILSISVLIGGFVQLLVLVPVLFKKGAPFKLFMTVFRHPQVKRIINLMGPAALGLAVYQVNVLVDTAFGSWESVVGEGSIPALYYGNRLMQFPLAIFGIAMATVIFPTMARQALRMEMGEFKQTFLFALKMVFFLVIPASVGFMVLGKPIVTLLFERNAFTAQSTRDTVTALSYYSLGLFAYAGIHITSRAFYSLQDMRTPVKVACLAMFTNIILNLILLFPLKLGGLALATSLSAGLNFFLLLYILNKKLGGIDGKAILSSLVRIILVSLFMGAVCYLTWQSLDGGMGSVTLFGKLLQVFLPIMAGMVVLFIISLLFKFEELKLFRDSFLHKK